MRGTVFVKRRWRSLKYEDVCLKAYDGINVARHSSATYSDFCNARRPHQSPDGRMPDKVHLNALPPTKVAA